MANSSFKLEGIVTTVLTPFTPELKVDYDSLQREIQAAVEAGSSGFLVPCLASEIAHLSYEERRELVKATSEVAKGKAAVIASINAPAGRERLALLEDFLSNGADGANVMLDYTTDDQYVRDIKEIDDSRPPFLILQDVDGAGDGLKDELLLRCFHEFDSVVGVKVEVKNNNPKYTRLLAATEGRINISSGKGNEQLIELLDRGVQVVMPSGLFEIFNGIYRRYASGNREGAKRLFYAALPIIAYTRQDGTINRAFHKRYLQETGIFRTTLTREKAYYDAVNEAYTKELVQLARTIVESLDQF